MGKRSPFSDGLLELRLSRGCSQEAAGLCLGRGADRGRNRINDLEQARGLSTVTAEECRALEDHLAGTPDELLNLLIEHWLTRAGGVVVEHWRARAADLSPSELRLVSAARRCGGAPLASSVAALVETPSAAEVLLRFRELSVSDRLRVVGVLRAAMCLATP